MVDAEHARSRIQDASGVQRAHQREKPAGSVGEPGDGSGGVRGGYVGDCRDDARGADRDDDVAGASRGPERRRRVVAGAGTEDRTRRRLARRGGGSQNLGHLDITSQRQRQQVLAYSPAAADQ